MIDVENLREAMSAKGLSQAELARRVGVSAAAIQQILNGSSKTSRSIREIARELGVSVEWLEGSVFDRHTTIEEKEFEPSDLDLALLPYNRIVRNEESDTVIQSSTICIGKNWLESITRGASSDTITIARIDDNDMSPTILPGEDVMLSYVDNYDGDPDGIWVFVYNNTTFFRRIRPVNTGYVSVDADNPMVASFQAKAEDIQIAARAIWFGRRLIHR